MRRCFFPMALRGCLVAGLVVLGLSAIAAAQEEEVDFETQVWPILHYSCVECHRAPYEKDGRMKKLKAELRLDAAWAILAGSEYGAVVSPGNAMRSELWIRCDLPEDDDDFMPPSGKADPLTDDQKALLARWINEGAEFGDWEGNLEGKPADSANGEEIPESEIQTIYENLSEGLTALEEEAWAAVASAGGRVMPLSSDSPLLAVDFRLVGDEADDAAAETVGAVGDHVVHLDFSKSSVTDAALQVVAVTPRLVRLDLHNTEVGDGALRHLEGLEHLRYLNLYGTQVSDAGLRRLEGIQSLRGVYLWQSQVTEKGFKKLRNALPDAKIIFK